MRWSESLAAKQLTLTDGGVPSTGFSPAALGLHSQLLQLLRVHCRLSARGLKGSAEIYYRTVSNVVTSAIFTPGARAADGATMTLHNARLSYLKESQEQLPLAGMPHVSRLTGEHDAIEGVFN